MTGVVAPTLPNVTDVCAALSYCTEFATPVDSDATELFVALRPVDSEVTELLVELRPVDNDVTPL